MTQKETSTLQKELILNTGNDSETNYLLKEIKVEQPYKNSIDLQTPQHKRKCLQKSVLECNDKGWTLKSNLLLLIWMSRCLYLLRSHYKRLRNARIGFFCLTTTYVIVSTFSSSLSFLNVGTSASCLQEDPSTRTITIIIGVATILSAMLAGILAFLKLGEMIGNERYVISKFSKMVREIEMVIYADIEDRPPATEFLTRINEKYYKYYHSAEILEENISDWRIRLQEAAKMNNSCFPEFQVQVNDKDIEQDGRIKLSENVIKMLQQSHQSRRSPNKTPTTTNTTPTKDSQEPLVTDDEVETDFQQMMSFETDFGQENDKKE